MSGADSGVYLLVMQFKKPRTIKVGALGTIEFSPGYYVYIGSARRGLAKRIERHKRKSKKLHWHIDYLSVCAEEITSVPIHTRENVECVLAVEIEKRADGAVPSFGCSDCRCRSHLFYFKDNPRVDLTGI